jgi:endogenous inhibitor of DNA gyrase (YacG/DUF329 family)
MTPEPARSPCPRCGRPIEARFCPECGERPFTKGQLSLVRWLAETGAALIDLEGPVAKSFVWLLTRPGELASLYVRGVRHGVVRPMQLFLLANLIYFVLQPFTGSGTFTTRLASHRRHQVYSRLVEPLVQRRLARGDMTAEHYASTFDALSDQLARALVIVLIPLLACGLWLLHVRRRRYAVEHLVLATSFTSFLLVYATIVGSWLMWLVLSLLPIPVLDGEIAGSTQVMLFVAVWSAVAFRRFYGGGWLGAIVRAICFCGIVMLAVVAYRLVLFGVAWVWI